MKPLQNRSAIIIKEQEANLTFTRGYQQSANHQYTSDSSRDLIMLIMGCLVTALSASLTISNCRRSSYS